MQCFEELIIARSDLCRMRVRAVAHKCCLAQDAVMSCGFDLDMRLGRRLVVEDHY